MTSSVHLGPTIKPVIRTFSGSFTVPVFKTMDFIQKKKMSIGFWREK